MVIQEIIDSALKPKEIHKPSGLISPSMLGQCYRRQYWKRSGEVESNPPDERSIRVFKCGHLFEEFVVKNLLIRYPNWKTQVEVRKDDVFGFADIVSEDTVWDVKSKHSKSFWYDKKEVDKGEDLKQIFHNHWLQVMIYTLLLGKSRGGLIYVSKDDLCINEYILPLDDFWQEEIRVELDTIRTYWDKKILPVAMPRLYGGEQTKKECSYCPFKTKCFSMEK